jgi:TM2 domain-containing membrane protein YozV
MNCPNCGAPVPPESNRCRKCGGAVQRATPSGASAFQAAPQVQVVFQTGPAAVPLAGAQIGPPVGPAVKSKVAAGILGILLGGLGMHRFYLGYVGIGIAQLLLTLVVSFFTCGISAVAAGIWGIVEGIMILTGGIDRDSQNRPLAG